MRYKSVPRELFEQTKQLVQLHLFLKHDIGIKDLLVKNLRIILGTLKGLKRVELRKRSEIIL